jgi:glycosyltransferase involved in cell wall biosynthesis
MKLLFFSPHTLLDSSSGAALCVSTMLSELVKLGHSCIAVTGSVTDAANQLFEQVRDTKPGESIMIENTGDSLPLRRINFNGVMNFIAGDGVGANALRAVDEVVLRRLFLDGFQQMDPDVVLTYGGFTSNYYAGQYAMARGRKSVLYVASTSYTRGLYQLNHGNMIHTVSGALCKLLETASDLPKITTKTFLRREDVIARARKPEYITFINPIPAKGVKIAAAIVRECARLQRPYKFLFVEGRGTRDLLYKSCPDLEGLPNLHIGNNTLEVRKIYARTAICLYPSVWFEPAGRIPLEANANGIPVLACDSGGIAEMLDGAGFLFNVPQASRGDHNAEVSVETVMPWIETLDRIHNEPGFMADAVSRARAADARYDLTAMAQAFATAVMA